MASKYAIRNVGLEVSCQYIRSIFRVLSDEAAHRRSDIATKTRIEYGSRGEILYDEINLFTSTR